MDRHEPYVRSRPLTSTAPASHGIFGGGQLKVTAPPVNERTNGAPAARIVRQSIPMGRVCEHCRAEAPSSESPLPPNAVSL